MTSKWMEWYILSISSPEFRLPDDIKVCVLEDKDEQKNYSTVEKYLKHEDRNYIRDI